MEFRSPPRPDYRNRPDGREGHSHPQPVNRRRPFDLFNRRIWLIAVGIVLIIALGAVSYGYIHTRNQLKDLSNPKTAGQSETQTIIKNVEKTLSLPTNEQPLLINVKDAQKARTQGNFFRSAQNGDKVLFYRTSGKALLYRPSTKKVIEYSLVNLNGS